MYNMTYISDYTEQQYIDVLKDQKKLENLQIEYFNQYTNKSNASSLAFKESLDHYVMMKITRSPELLKKDIFRNYLIYILGISNSKVSKTPDGYTLNIELATNPIFRDEKLRNQIFDLYLSPEQKLRYEKAQLFTKEYINLIFKSMSNGKKLNQSYIDIAADYIYSSRDISGDKGKIFAKYILNNSKKYNLKSSPAIDGAMLTIATNNYSLDENVKNTRFYVAEYDVSKQVSIAHSNGSKKYCVFQKTFLDNLSLTSYDSMFISRTSKKIDIYWLLMVANHELTHQHQNNDYNAQKLTSSGISCAIKRALQHLMPKATINNKVVTDYSINHDTDEFEMEADEEGWRQVRKFIHEYVDDENRIITDEDGKKHNLWILAKQNEEKIQIRRAFSTKKDVEAVIRERDLPPEKRTPGMYYAHYDILNLTKKLKENPQALESFPLLKNFYDKTGNLKVLDILKMDIYRNSQEDAISSNDRNNSGLELGTFVLNHKWNEVERQIASGKLTSQEEIKQISVNLYRIIHESILKIRDYSRIIQENKDINYRSISSDQYKETKTRFNLNDDKSSKELYEYYYKCIVVGVERFYRFRQLIKRMYNITLDDQFKYYSGYVLEAYEKLIDKNNKKCMNAINIYATSADPNLVRIYESIMEQKANERTDNIKQSMN